MKYFVLFLVAISCMINAGITINTNGLNSNIDQTTDKAHKYTESKRQERLRRARERATTVHHGANVKVFKCTYRCRTNGFMGYDSTPKTSRTTRATSHFEAKLAVERYAKQQCANIRGENGMWMWVDNLDCKEVK
jgi:hypothetical protein